MADPRFFSVVAPIPLASLASEAAAEIVGGDGAQTFEDVAALAAAGPAHVSFLDNTKYVDQFLASKAGACLVRPEMVGRQPEGMALLVTPEPYLGYAKVARLFYPAEQKPAGVFESAYVAPSARLGAGVSIAPGAIVGERAEIGDNVTVGANTVIGNGCVIGADSAIDANVTLSHCLIGARVVIYAGVRIGQDGFGFARSPQGAVKVPQLGRVVIEDDVEIGANTTIDRGAGPDTFIGAGTKIDNLVQIGHNVRIGRHCIIVAQAGVSGSTEIGNGVVIGGQTGFAGHLQVGDGAQVAAKSGVFRDVSAGDKIGGYPAKAFRQWFKEQAYLERLTRKGK
jgi:UDP-3-O-[3-hydroxymyristoyl] glucosamine N-acyltransferase